MIDGRDALFQELPVVVGSPVIGQHRPQPGIRPTRRAFHSHEITEIEGVRIATLARAAYDLALDARGLEEAVVAFDMCTSTVIDQVRTTIDDIVAVVDSHHKTRGIRRARAALALSSRRSASPWESRTRMVAERRADIGGLGVNVPIFGPDTRLAGIADLLQEEDGLVLESDGAGHRLEQSHSDDNVRESTFEGLGLVVGRVGSIDHRDTPRLVARLGAARLQARANRNPRRWTTVKPDWWWTWPPGRRYD